MKSNSSYPSVISLSNQRHTRTHSTCILHSITLFSYFPLEATLNMKISILYASLVLLGAVSAQEACIEGKRVAISPDYIVEYRCNKYRLGQRHGNVLSHEDCADKCEASGLDVCSYHAANKICYVGDPNGKEGPYHGSTYMIRVEEEPEDPFTGEEDPFAQTCEEQRDDFRSELDKCRADLEAASKKPSCGVDKWGLGYYSMQNGMNLENCKNACNSDANCLSYSANKGSSGTISCFLYNKETADVPDRTNPNFVQYDKRCG
jgi:hypothetical protein